MSRNYEAFKPLPCIEDLNKMLTLDPSTGDLFWNRKGPEENRANWWNSVLGGKPAGSKRKDGYISVFINGTHYMAHRLIWKMLHNEDALEVDHINGLKDDNRPENLRNVSHQINSKNRKLYLTNSSGMSGVKFHKRDGIWYADISVSGKQIYLGSFQTKEEAVAARVAAEIILEYHENHGRRTETQKEA